jgi:hypothetical protein
MDRVLDDWTRKPRIKHLGQSITTTAKGGINDVTKGAQALKGFCFHAPPYAKARLSCLSPFAFSLLLVNWQVYSISDNISAASTPRCCALAHHFLPMLATPPA